MLSRQTLAAFREGDRTAFEEVLRTYTSVVRRVAERCFTGTFDREEAMQEVWLHIWKNRAAIDADRAAELVGWIAVTARRRCIDLQRRRPDSAEVPLDDDVDVAADAPPPDGPERQELQAAVAAFVQTLKPLWGRFFELHFVQGLTYGEVGAQLAISTLRCRYMKKVLAARARKNRGLLAALARTPTGAPHAS